jgi:hypothetical protein
MTIGERTKLYEKKGELGAPALLEAIESFLAGKEDMEVQSFELEGGYVLQAKKRDDWKKYLMLDNAIQINIKDIGSHVQVEIGGGKWASKAIAGTIGLLSGFTLFSLALVGFSAFGAADLYTLPDRVFSFLSAAFPESESRGEPLKSALQRCPQCRAALSRASNFCPNCGERLVRSV